MDEKTRNSILIAQKNEITESLIYRKLAEAIKDRDNREVLIRIADDEERHYRFWKRYTDTEVRPNRFRAWWFVLISRALGLMFGIKLMERSEAKAQVVYEQISHAVDGAQQIVHDEDEHEDKLINMINEEKLKYVGSMVLGLNDALVELTGALAGFTLALQNTRLIAMAGLITGIAASLSMATSEYLSTKSEGGEQNPIKASVYTGIAYVFTVIFLIFPYLIFANLYVCLGIAIANAIVVILVFTFYISVAQDLSFRARFFEMAGISLGVALLTFGIGYVIRIVLGIEV